MLEAHFHALDQTATAEDLGLAAGYPRNLAYRITNAAYSALGRRLRAELQIPARRKAHRKVGAGHWILGPDSSVPVVGEEFLLPERYTNAEIETLATSLLDVYPSTALSKAHNSFTWQGQVLPAAWANRTWLTPPSTSALATCVSANLREQSLTKLLRIMGLGIAVASKWVCFVDPKRYGMYDSRVSIALRNLQIDGKCAFPIVGRRPPKGKMEPPLTPLPRGMWSRGATKQRLTGRDNAPSVMRNRNPRLI